MNRKNNQQITAKNPRAAGSPTRYEQPARRVTIRATNPELERINELDTRRRAEVLLEECDDVNAFVESMQPTPRTHIICPHGLPICHCAKCEGKRKREQDAPIDEKETA